MRIYLYERTELYASVDWPTIPRVHEVIDYWAPNKFSPLMGFVASVGYHQDENAAIPDQNAGFEVRVVVRPDTILAPLRRSPETDQEQAERVARE